MGFFNIPVYFSVCLLFLRGWGWGTPAPRNAVPVVCNYDQMWSAGTTHQKENLKIKSTKDVISPKLT